MRHLSQYTPHTFHSFDGTKIYYEVSSRTASAPVLIFIHGLGGDLTAWDKEREYFLKKGYKTIALDLRGHGLSQRGIKQNFYSIDNFAKDILMLIEKAELNNFIIIGHSFGGFISIQLQGKYQTAAKGLILVASNYKLSQFNKFITNNVFIKTILSLLANTALPIGTPGHANYDKYIGTSDLDVKRIFSDIMHTSLRSHLLTATNLNKPTIQLLVVPGRISVLT